MDQKGQEVNSPEVANLVEFILREQHEHMSYKEFANITDSEIEDIIELCREGILGPGDAQYANIDGHRFETMPLVDLLAYIEEEARDMINYGVFMLWRVGQINSALVVALRHQMIQALQSHGSIAPIDSSALPPDTEESSAPPLSPTSRLTSLKEESVPGERVYPWQE